MAIYFPIKVGQLFHHTMTTKQQEKPRFTLDFEKPIEELERSLAALRANSTNNRLNVSDEIQAIEQKIEVTKHEVYSKLSAWQKVQLARHPERPHALDYIKSIFDDFQPLHGDRAFKDDQAIIGGTAFLNGQAVMVVGTQKGRNTKEKIRHNFGSPHAEGYRKALRLMETANTFGLPIITLIDTAGAYPGIGSEERHVAEAIAVNLREMSRFNVPIIAAVLGEGGSGGALGIGVVDRILILENAYYSVISPEGCAAILWKDRAYAPDAAEALQLTAEKLKELDIADEIIPEPLGGAHRDTEKTIEYLKQTLIRHLDELKQIDSNTLIDMRYKKFRKIGVFAES